MVRSCDGNGVEVFVGKCFADVRDAFRGEGSAFGFDLFAKVFHTTGEDFLVRVDQIGDLDILLPEKTIDVAFATSIKPGDSETEAIICSDDLCSGGSSGNERGDTGGERGFEELATFVDHDLHKSYLRE